ncbi:MAG: hypothetical protein HC906_04725 [Bacteroidales bacterium]|nr:hypothetical protein [Bacteroidales bacterium]
MNSVHGIGLVKITINPMGIASDIEVIKGLDAFIDSLIFNSFKELTLKKSWISGNSGRNKITQEILFPISYSLNSYGSYYYKIIGLHIKS